MSKLKALEKSTVLWERCFNESACIDIPFDGRKCLTARGCIRIIKDGPRYLIELELLGNRVRYELGKTCFPAYTIGIATLEVCAEPDIDHGNLRGVIISANLCIGGKIDGIDLKKCWQVIRSNIRFFQVNSLKANANDIHQMEDDAFIAQAKLNGAEYVYVESNQLEEMLYGQKQIIHEKIGR